MNAKRQHRKQKTAADIRAEIEALQDELTAKTKAEQEKIGAEMQRRFGVETWDEIKILLDDVGAKWGKEAITP